MLNMCFVMNVCACFSSQTALHSVRQLEMQLAKFTQNQTFVLSMVQFLRANKPTADVKFQPAFHCMLQTFDDLRNDQASLPIDHVIGFVYDAV